MEIYKKIKADIRRAGFESQAISEKVKLMKLPEDVRAWLDDAVKFANDLPGETKMQNIILRYISFAQSSINDEQKLKEYLYHIEKNINNAKDDIKLMKQNSGAKNVAHQSKRKVCNVKYKANSAILKAVHETASELFQHGFINQKRMREFDLLCLKELPEYSTE